MRWWVRIRTVRVHAHPGAYTHRWVRIHARLDRSLLDDLDVYTQRVRVFLGIASRYTQVGAYTRNASAFGKDSMLL